VDLARVPQPLEAIQQFLAGEFIGMLYRPLSTAPGVRGAGNEVILACDMCFASRARVFGQMEAGLDLLLAPEACSTLHGSWDASRDGAVLATTVLSLRRSMYGWINRAIADAT
jgi:hypothetical protein